MILIFIKIAFRRLWKEKAYSALHALGVSIGICCFLCISLYTSYELNYEKNFDGYELIYRLNTISQSKELPATESALSNPLLADAFKEEFPEHIEHIGSFTSIWGSEVSTSHERAYEYDLWYASKGLFSVFELSFIYGSPEQMTDSFDIVISQKAAEKYFGQSNVINRKIHIDVFNNEFTVKGVFATLPPSVHFQCDFLVSPQLYPPNNLTENILFTYNHNYIRINESISKKEIDQLPITINNKYLKGTQLKTKLEPITDIHLFSEASANPYGASNVKYIYGFISLGLMVLLLTSLNYINITIAISQSQFKDIAIRKTLGATKANIFLQYIITSILLCLISAFVAIVIFELFIPTLEKIADKPFGNAFFSNINWLIYTVAFSILLGIINGSYPALFLSSRPSLQALKQHKRSSSASKFFRLALLVFQFSITSIIIFSAITVQRQSNYIDNADLGINKENIAVLHRSYIIKDKFEAFKADLLSHTEIEAVANILSIPGPAPHFESFTLHTDGTTNSKPAIKMSYIVGDLDLYKIYSPTLTDGHYWDSILQSDTATVVINETAAQLLGIEKLNGQSLSIATGCTHCHYKIIGIVKDFINEDIKTEIKPLVVFRKQSFIQDFTLIQAKAELTEDILNHIESVWYNYSDKSVFFARTMADCQSELYQEEENTKKLLYIFAAITIIIASLGLYGIVSYSLRMRMLELSIRMVNGASELQIVILLMRELFSAIAISVPIGLLVSYFIAVKWYENFVYHVTISIFEFSFPIICIITMLLITAKITAWKLARKNFNKALHYE